MVKHTLEALGQVMQEGMAFVEPDGRLLFCNSSLQAALELPLGPDTDRLTWKGLLARCYQGAPPPEAEQAFRTLFQRRTPDSPASVEVPGPCNQQLRWSSIPAKDGATGFLGWVILVEGLTEAKRASWLSLSSISIVAHEFRGFISNMRMCSNLLLSGVLGREEQREWLLRCDRELSQLSSLVDNFLRASQLEVGPREVHTTEVSLWELVQLVLEGYEATAEKHRLINGVPEALPRVMADSDLVRVILRNLVDNAIKYSPQGGVVETSAEMYQPDPQFMVVKVSDQGIGIHPEHLAQLFTPFRRLPDPPTQEIPGIGLGLFVTKTLVEAHQGQLWVESQVGKGSTFLFTLPAARPATGTVPEGLTESAITPGQRHE
ncbi:MAG: sensor histidine kinase [Dehalococcoidia bacterium]